MFSFTNLLIGLALIGAGILMVKYTFWLTNTTGALQWLEKFTGGGSTYGIYKLFGVLLAILGFFVATGLGGGVMNFIFSPLKQIFVPVG